MSDKVVLSNVVVVLADMIRKANDKADGDTLSELHITFDMLAEVIAQLSARDKQGYIIDDKNRAIYRLLREIASSAQHAAMGVIWKSPLPSEEEIKTILS